MTATARTGSWMPPLDGLSIEETIEFEVLDSLPAIDDAGKPAWIFEGEPTNHLEKRWLELYSKQTRARPASE